MRKLTAVVVLLALLLSGAPRPAQANSLLLDATTKSLEMETGTASSTDYVVAYADHTSSAFTPGMNQGNVASATTTTILAAPAASTQRQVKWVSVRNRSTTAPQTVTLKLDVSATEYHIGPAVTLGAGEALRMDADGALTIFTAAGIQKTQATDINGYNGEAYSYFKVGTAAEAAGQFYSFAKDAGTPGAWVPGTPGINGDALSCDTAADATIAGAHVIPDPASGSFYLTDIGWGSTVAHLYQFTDLVWYNTGIAVTTTTGQNITQPTLPARDLNGTNNGDGWVAAIYVTTATTNAGAVTNTTLTYTDSDGNAGNTGTIASFPATAVAGTLAPFRLAAGDRGIRSIQTITLGTSYGGGAISLIHYRKLASIPHPLALVGAVSPSFGPPGIRLYNDTCLWGPIYLASATTVTAVAGTVSIMER